ncbi:MAG: PGN_0703 family putative restriction endonuclease [Ilumatobacteraceae bacterium]
MGKHETQVDTDKTLAYGLAWSGDRDLILVLPDGTQAPTLRRAAFLDAPIRVFTHGDEWREHPIPAERQVLGSIRDPLVTTAHALGSREPWVADLLAWADSHPDLRPAHRPSYLSWHCLGRMVIKIARSRRGLRVTAGVHTGAASSSYAPLVRREVTAAGLGGSDLDALRTAASAAIADRLSGKDAGHREHFLQAQLGDHCEALGLQHVEREFPCVRPGGDRAYIDLLGVDASGDLHVVETKIGDDLMLVLQGVDYYAWTLAHQSELATHFRLGGSPRIFLDYAVSPATEGGVVIGPYTASQAEVLNGSVPWRFLTVSNWEDPAAPPKVTRLGRRKLPSGTMASVAKLEPRYAVRMHAHLHRHLQGKLGRDGVTVGSLDDHLLPEARSAWLSLDEQGRLHGWARHMRSSQAFALNLFGPLDESAAADLLSTVFGPMESAQRAEFEYEDDLDELRESQTSRPHRTQIDVVLRGTTTSGRAVVLAIEVKLTENDFGHCSAATSAANDTAHVCVLDGPWGGQPESCFQLRNHNGAVRRRYEHHVRPPDWSPDGTAPGCWYRTSASQPMRNVALADVIAGREHADVRFALCAPGANEVIWRRWDDARGVLPDESLMDLPAEHVLAHHSTDSIVWLRSRYQLDEPVRHDLAVDVEWLTWKFVASLTARDDVRRRVLETHPGGGLYDCIALAWPDGEQEAPQIHLNRVGSGHVLRPDGAHDRVGDLWERAARRGAEVAANDLAMLAGMPSQGRSPTPLWERFAELVAEMVLSGRRVHWRNGFSDDQYGDGIRRDLFEAWGTDRLDQDAPDLWEVAMSHWFLVEGDRPIAHARTTPDQGEVSITRTPDQTKNPRLPADSTS